MGRQIKIGGATYKKYVSAEKKWIDEQKTKLEEDKAAHEKDKETFERIYKNIKQSLDKKTPKIKQLQKALKGYTKSYEIEIIDDVDPLTQLTKTRKEIKLKLASQLKQMKGMKYIETLKVTFEKQLDEDRTTIKTAYFNNKTYTIINNNDINQALKISTEEILNRIAQWLSEGSGWTIESIDNHYINLTKHKPLKGSSYIELHVELRNSLKGLINIKNKDNECFRWCHIRHLNLINTHPERITKKDKQYINKLNYTDIEFPVSQKQYNKIEKQNNININVFGYENKQAYPIYVSKEKFDDYMDLLLITEDNKQHYVYIKDFNRFMYNQSKHRERKHFCKYCLQCFSSEEILIRHKENCIMINGKQAIKMPTNDNNILKFNNFHKQLDVPFVIYADFEAITEKTRHSNP